MGRMLLILFRLRSGSVLLSPSWCVCGNCRIRLKVAGTCPSYWPALPVSWSARLLALFLQFRPVPVSRLPFFCFALVLLSRMGSVSFQLFFVHGFFFRIHIYFSFLLLLRMDGRTYPTRLVTFLSSKTLPKCLLFQKTPQSYDFYVTLAVWKEDNCVSLHLRFKVLVITR